jgi:hypothetical protein
VAIKWACRLQSDPDRGKDAQGCPGRWGLTIGDERECRRVGHWCQQCGEKEF